MKAQIQTAQLAGGGNPTPISPVLIECIQQLREVSRKIFELCGDPLHDCRSGYLNDFEEGINNAADSIAEMARVDLLDNVYFSEPEGKKEESNSIIEMNK